ncbi:MAG: S8 family serine peptidase [Limisphaerales bacterium]
MILAFSQGSALAETKTIRLRNEAIRTETPAPPALRLQAPPERVTGLYLVQFVSPPTLASREELAASGVELLRYVPDDAFIARLSRTDLSHLRTRPFIQWVGEYRPDHKVAARLREWAVAGQPLDISLQLVPDATPAERVAIRRAMQRFEREATLPQGAILRGRITPSQLAFLARSPLVLWIEPAPRMKLIDEIASKIVGGGDYETGEPGDDFPGLGGGGGEDDDDIFGAGPNARRLGLHGLPSVEHQTTTHQLGFDGTGVVVAVADSGLNNGDAESMHPDLAGRVDAFFHYGSLTDASDEHSHGTHVTGIIAGDGATGEEDPYGNLYGLGVAPNAHIVAQRIFDGIGNYEPPPSMETLTRDASRAGAVIGSNSWGDDTQGRYDLSAAEFDALVRDADELSAGEQPYILEFSAGNSGPGPQTIGSPAVAKNVIASGASQNDRYGFFLFEDGPDAMADFSSRGPCEDGRIKPDVVAPGTWIASLQSESATDENAWTPISANYQFQGGTSQSGPHVSGAAAVFVQYWRETRGGATPSPALVKGALINSAIDLDDELGGTDPIPNNDEGWGRVTLTNLMASTRRFDYVDQSVTLTNQAVFERRILVGNPRLPLKITLTYTDVPGLPAAIPALVNDLDLEVVAPDGAQYRGNAFAGGESIPNAFASDSINNVEGIHLAVPASGEYLVRVRATRVVEDIHRRTGIAPVQDFAMVISGDLPLPGEGVVILDRVAYATPATVAIRLIDFDLRALSSVDVQAQSDTEPVGEPVTLTLAGAAGVFTGSVAIATGAATPDGRLQVAHGDVVSVSYADASPAGTRIGQADIDLEPPVLANVSASTRFGRLIVTWETDEDADAVVEYGTTATLGNNVTNRTFTTDHRVPVDGLTRDQTIFFQVRSRDLAGNESVRDDAGKPFETRLAASATVLLVDQFDDLLLNDYLTIATYTDALDAVGVSYEVWDVFSEGRSPSFEDLRNYPVVIWRVGEFFSSLGTKDVQALRDYVNDGGGLFMASMELLSRLDESGFTNFRKGILHVDEYEVDPGIEGIFGSDSLSMTSGVDTPLDFSEFPDLIIIPSDLSDTFRTTPDAAPIFFDAGTGFPVGVRYPKAGEDGSGGRVVFFSFPLDAIPAEGDAPNNRAEILRRVIAFLAPGTSGLATLQLDREEYSLPARLTIEVTDPDLAAGATVTVRVTSPRVPAGQDVELVPAGRPGLVRGHVLLINDTPRPLPDEFPANHGDLIEVRYADVPPGQPLSVAAVVDTEAPAVTGVALEPDYTEAIVRWTTSEPTDGLAKYLDPGFPSNFTVYHAEFIEEHELLLTGLEPDREYQVEVVSRDPAGNTTTDNNGGQRYRFRTLKPLSPPFRDGGESGSGNWTVGSSSIDAETLSLLASSYWELGRPANELASSAFAGTASWGTNLRGEANDFAEASLISPAILLSGGNRAILKFAHNYDFFPRSEELDIIEFGGVYVTTNNGAVWTPLREYGEASDGWETEEVDLSAYLGKTVRLGWAYALFSLDTIEHPGWLVDEVEVTLTTFVPGTLILSNNLHQAAVSIRGPLNRVERGLMTTITNAPPGEYQFEYADVPFHGTPATRTRSLTEGGTLVVEGTYTMSDTNADGISDAWEERFLGAAAPGHLASADFDGDGFSDFAEFIAGSNPTNATSRLTLLPPTPAGPGLLTLKWESAIGHGYRLWGSSNALDWLPLTDWLRAASTAQSTTVPSPTNGAPYLFQLQVER